MMLRSMVLALVLLPGAAFAWDEPPGYWRVTGVAAGDVLNIRAAPEAGAEAIGTLAPGAGPVEVSATDPSGAWGRVAFQGVEGWVAMRFLESVVPETLGETALPAGLSCSGTEPFWSLSLPDAGTAIWSDPLGEDPNNLDTTLAVSFLAGASNRSGLPVMLQAGAEGITLTAAIGPATCYDVGETTHPYSVVVLFNGAYGPTVQEGCCQLDLPE